MHTVFPHMKATLNFKLGVSRILNMNVWSQIETWAIVLIFPILLLLHTYQLEHSE